MKEIARHHTAGEGMQYSMHIYREIRWQLNFTPDVEATQARIADLRPSLNQPELRKLAASSRPPMEAGGWASMSGISSSIIRSRMGSRAAPRRPSIRTGFLTASALPRSSPSSSTPIFTTTSSEQESSNGKELGETFSALARLLYGHKQTGCAFDPQLSDALRQFVARWQNPETGFWGQWLVDRHGRIWKMDDMAMTFHVVSDLHGVVEHKDLIAKRLLQLDEVNFPPGIRFDGHYENHLNMDVVKIFRLTWPALDESARQQARTEISGMLDWCLTQSLQPDGSFKVSELDDTTGDAYNYAVSFFE